MKLEGQLSSKLVLLTGVSGFVGSNIVVDLVQNGVKVLGVYRTALPDFLRDLADNDRCRFIRADLTERFEIPDTIDVIVHAAAQVRPARVSDHLENSVATTKNLVEYARQAGVRKIVYFSSLSVCGEVRTSVVDESTERINVSEYGLSKYLSELVLKEAVDEIASISMRLPGILGKGAHGSWLSKVFRKALRDETIEIFNPDALFNNAVHLRGIARFVVSLLEQEWTCADVVTLGCKDPMTVGELTEMIVDLCNSSSEIVVKQTVTNSFVVSYEKSVRVYRYLPSSLRDILRIYARECKPA